MNSNVDRVDRYCDENGRFPGFFRWVYLSALDKKPGTIGALVLFGFGIVMLGVGIAGMIGVW